MGTGTQRQFVLVTETVCESVCLASLCTQVHMRAFLFAPARKESDCMHFVSLCLSFHNNMRKCVWFSVCVFVCVCECVCE